MHLCLLLVMVFSVLVQEDFSDIKEWKRTPHSFNYMKSRWCFTFNCSIPTQEQSHSPLPYQSFFQCGQTDKQMHFHLCQRFTPKSWDLEYHPTLTPPFQMLLHRASPGLLSNFILRAQYKREELWGPSALPRKVAILQLLAMKPCQFLQSLRQAQLYNIEM